MNDKSAPVPVLGVELARVRVPVPAVSEGKVAWVGAWPITTVDPGVAPSFTRLQMYSPRGVTKHWVPVRQHQYPGSFGI